MVDVIVLAGTAKSSELTIAEQVQNKALCRFMGRQC